jgi:hypothetical protein
MPLSWLNLPCALKAAISAVSGHWAPSPVCRAPGAAARVSRPYRATRAPPPGPNGGVADSVDDAKAAFRGAWERHRLGSMD